MVNILARILDSERNFNGSADPTITADRGFIYCSGPDFGFWLLGSSDRGSLFLSLSVECHAVEKVTRNSEALKRDGSVMAVMKVASQPSRPSHLSDLWSESNPIMKAWAHAATETGFIQFLPVVD